MRVAQRLFTILIAVTLVLGVFASSALAAPPNRKLTVAKNGTGTGTVTSSPGGINCGATCMASFTTGSTVTLTAVATAGSTFTGWSGAGCAGTGTCMPVMNSNLTATATFTANGATLSVTKAGNGSGTVTSSPAGISCGATCSASFVLATVVTLTASAGPNSTFTGWSGGGCAGTGTCVVTINSATAVTATFTLNTHLLSVSKDGGGTGTVTSSPAGISCGATCSFAFDHGTPVTLTAAATGGSTFMGWSGAGCTGTGTCNVTMNAAASVTATFEPATHSVTVTPAGTGSGVVTSAPSGIDCGGTCTAPFNTGSSVGLLATPDAGSTFTGWSDDCAGTGTCTLSMTADHTVTATFTPIPRTLTVTKSGNGTGGVASTPGGIDCGGTCSAPFDNGTAVQLDATADPGSTFAGWSGACAGVGTCNVTMDQAQGVTATFVLVPRQLTVTPAGTGSGTVTSVPVGISCGATCDRIYNDGTAVSLTATAATGSTFTGWSGDCSGTGACNLTMDADKNVTATFTIQTRTVTVTTTGAGSGTVTSAPAGITCGVTCGASFDYGTVVTLSAAPDGGSTFAGWTGDCAAFGTGACPLTIDGNMVVGASFVTVPQTLTVVSAGAGGGSVTSSPTGVDCGSACAYIFQNGTAVTLTAVPDAGSSFSGWSGSGCSGTGTCNITMNTDKAVTATFAKIPHTLTVTTSGGGTGVVASVPAGIDCGATCTAQFDSGTGALLFALPDTGSTFLGWTGACSGTGLCSLTMDADRSVGATFAGPEQPDGAIKKSTGTAYVGENVINTTGQGQTVLSPVKRRKSVSFNIKVTNVGAQADTFTVKSNKGSQKPFKALYFKGSLNITAQVVAGTYTTASLAPGQSEVLTLKVKASRKAHKGSKKTWLVTSTSVSDGTEKDTVGATAKAR